MYPQPGSVPPVPPRATNSLAVCLWLASQSSGLPSVVPMGPAGHPGPELANPVHAKRPSQLCGNMGWQPAQQPLCLQLMCWAFPGCPGSFPDMGAVVGPFCPSKPLLLGTAWGHRVHCAFALCFLPPVVSIFFLTTGNKRECHQHTLYCLFLRSPAMGQCRPSPCTPLSIPASLADTRVGGCEHPRWPGTSQAAPTRDDPCTWSHCWEQWRCTRGA